MTAISARFDAVRYIQSARKIGFTQEQAEFNAQELEHVIESITSNQDIVTKQDLICLELRLVKWVVATGAVTILSIAGLLKYMH